MYHNLVQIIFCSFTLMTLVIGIILLLFFSKRNRVQLLLVAILIFWALPMPELLVEFINRQITSQPAGVLNIEELLRGFMGFTTILLFPLSVLYWRIFTKKHVIIYLLPILLTFIAYFVWHSATDNPWNIRYETLDEFWGARYSVTVILRLVLAMWCIVYTLALLYIVLRLIPLYQTHSEDHYSDAAYSIKWIRGIVLLLVIQTTVWMLTLFFGKYLIVHIFFVISINTIFITFITKVIFLRAFKSPSEFNIAWSWRRGWYIVEPELDFKNLSTRILPKIDEWMQSEKAFTDNDFCAKDVYQQFPELGGNQLSILLSTRGENFQSYVRRLRIEEACSAITNNPQIRSSELAYAVGFSSPSAFNHAFSSVIGETPTLYKEKLK